MVKVNYKIRFIDTTGLDLLAATEEQLKILATMQVEREDIQTQSLSSNSSIIFEGNTYELETRVDAYTECKPETKFQ
jgi:hypothetical protein